MERIEESITIERPIDEVFRFLTDIPHQSEWVGVLLDSSLTSDGPVREGSTFSQTVKLLGRRIEGAMKVTAYDPPRRYEFSGRSGPMHMDMRFSLSPEGSGTRVHQVAEGESGGLFKLADSIVARTMAKQIQADLVTLKSLLEAGATPGE